MEGTRKPEPAIYERLLERLRVKAEEAVFLDDIGANLKPAREMGMHTIKVNPYFTVISLLFLGFQVDQLKLRQKRFDTGCF